MVYDLKNRIALIGLLLLLLSHPPLLQAHAGKVIFVTGSATVTNKEGRMQGARRGMDIWPGDVIVTGDKSRVQLRTGDGSSVSLQSYSRFIIKEHLHSGPVEKQHSVIELLKGGMRAVTGAIGKKNPENFQIKARDVTIGIRGTEIVVQLCEDNCSIRQGKHETGEKKPVVKNGVYVGVLNGAITVARNEKKVDLDASLKVVLGEIMGIDKDKRQYVFVSDAEDEPPEALQEPPPVLLQALSPPPPDEKGGAQVANPLSPYEGVSTEQMLRYLHALSSKGDRHGALAAFDGYGMQGGIDPLIKHRDVVAPYFGRDGSGLYDLTSGKAIFIAP